MRTWILIADSSRALLLTASSLHGPYELDRVIPNPMGKARDQELVSDAPGRYRKGGALAVRSALEPSTAAHEVIVYRFARALAAVLRDGYERDAFATAAVVAPPQLLGRLERAIPDRVKRCVVSWVGKDLAKLDLPRLTERLPRLLVK